MGAFFSKPKASGRKAEELARQGLEVLYPADEQYTAREQSFWSNSAKIHPACIVRPRNALEVSKAVKYLAAKSLHFAVRSGGHTQWAGSNNIHNGVTIDLGRLCWTKVDGDSKTVDIGPGGCWRDVYAELHKHGLVVAGGREGNVGVAGLILGGGNTFYTPRRGFACDNVVEYEVVLADGRIIKASAKQNDDLYFALKGGSNNFGIVTNFKMKAFKTGPLWGGLMFFPKQVTEAAAEALTDFTSNMQHDLDSNILCFFAYTVSPQLKDVGIATLYAQVAGVENPAAYNNFTTLPSLMSTCKMTTVPEMVSAPEYNLPGDYYSTWFTASFKNDSRIVKKAAELHEVMVEEFKAHIADGDFWTQCLFQPLPKLFGQRSAEAGGNVTGVQDQIEDGLLFQASAMVRTAEQEAFAYPKIKAWIEEIKLFAATIEGGNLPWVYLNYADQCQDPLSSYGKENLQKLRAVCRMYDPQQVFQKLCPGGFKVSAVRG
ncbi:hypothetical protein KCV07_g7976, partial [Aureobasidium melanogenum]